jgi:hypothetical protein
MLVRKTGRKWMENYCIALVFLIMLIQAEAVCRVPSYSEVVAEHWQ